MASSQQRQQKKAEKKKRKDEERRLRAVQSAKKAALPPPPPNRIAFQYPSPEALVAMGPTIHASWEVPTAHAAALAQAGKPVPPPVTGVMLVDTGASHTCISLQAATDLGLIQVGIGNTYGAGGLHQNNLYQAVIKIGIADSMGNSSVVTSEIQVMAIPKLGDQMNGVKSNGIAVRLIGLLGRDFLRHATLTYSGTKGHFEIRLDHASMTGQPI